MRVILKILAVLYLVCVVFQTKPHYSFLGLEYQARKQEQRLAKDLEGLDKSLATNKTKTKIGRSADVN